MEDIIIIGAGPIGLYSATLASLHGLKGFVIEGLDIVGGQLSSLYPEKDIVDLPGFSSIKAQEFIDALLNQAKSRNNPLEIKTHETMLSYIKEDDHFVITTNKNTYLTRTLLLTTGMGLFTPRKLDVEGASKYQNIIYFLKETNFLKDKDVVILGGGDSACDWAIMLSKVCKNVSIVHRRDEFRAKDETVKEMEKLGVHIYKPFQVKSLSGENNIAKEITLTNKEDITLKFDYLFVNYGLVTIPTKANLQMKMNAFEVSTNMMTSEENIFAIGNACYYEGKVKNITSGLGEAVTAITKIDQIIHPNKNIPVHF